MSAGKSVLGRDSRATSVNSNGDMFVYHTLPEVTSVYPNTVRPLLSVFKGVLSAMFQPQGGVEGGTHIKIEGNSFDGYHGSTTVSWLS